MVMNLGKRFLSGWSWESLRSTLGKGTWCQNLGKFVEIDPGLEAYKKGRYILLAFQEGCRWNNFTDDLNGQIVSKSTTKLRRHIQKWKIKHLFKALSLTVVLKMQCHLFMYSLFELVLRCFENLPSNDTAALVY